MKYPGQKRHLQPSSRSRKGAWIEIGQLRACPSKKICRSRKGAWIEMWTQRIAQSLALCRSRKGAWIEMAVAAVNVFGGTVAPVRERGLKCVGTFVITPFHGRSRKGAWIEIE